jgi:hypothetical protein
MYVLKEKIHNIKKQSKEIYLQLMTSDCTKGYTSGDKWVLSIILALLASLIFSPFLFSITNAVFMWAFGVRLATISGLPNLLGLIIHTIVVFLLFRVILI